MKKLFALLLAVMMVVALVPAVISSAEEVDFSVPTDGESAREIADYNGKPVTQGTRAEARTYGTDYCFGVYGADGNEVGQYKTWDAAWAVMANGYTLKLLGDVHATGFNNISLTLKKAGTYTVDGCGFVFDVEMAKAKTTTYQFALKFVVNTGSGVDNQIKVNFNNFALISDAGCMELNAGGSYIQGGAGPAYHQYNLTNCKFYAGDGYYLVHPEYYPEEFVRPSQMYKVVSGKTVPADGYIQHAALYITNRRQWTTFSGADTVVYGRNAAIRAHNGQFTLNDGLVKCDDTVYNGTADADGKVTTKSGDSAAIFVNPSNKEGNANYIYIKGGKIVNTFEGAKALGNGVRLQEGSLFEVTGGEFYTTGACVHVRRGNYKNGSNIVNIEGGLFVALPTRNMTGNFPYEQSNGLITANPEVRTTQTVETVHPVITVSGGTFINQRVQNKSFVSVTDDDAKCTVNVTGGLYLSHVNATDMQYVSQAFNISTVAQHTASSPWSINVKTATLDGGKTVMYQGEQYYVCEAPKATANEVAPVMDTGASMLLSSTTNGIKFTAQVKKTAGATYGMLIVPTDYALKALAEGGVLTKEALLAAATDTSKVVDIAATLDNEKLVDKGNSYTIVGEITSTANDIRGMSLTAIAYTTVGTDTYYAAVNLAKNSRSISYVARMALGDVRTEKDDTFANASIYNEALGIEVYSPYTAEQQNLIKDTLSVVDEGAVRALLDIKFIQTKEAE